MFLFLLLFFTVFVHFWGMAPRAPSLSILYVHLFEGTARDATILQLCSLCALAHYDFEDSAAGTAEPFKINIIVPSAIDSCVSTSVPPVVTNATGADKRPQQIIVRFYILTFLPVLPSSPITISPIFIS